MNPIWIKNKEIDRNKWDNCINTCNWGNIYAMSFYLDFITNLSWDALIIGDYEYVMPVPVKSKAGIEITYRPDFCQQLGLFSLKNENDNNILELFLIRLSDRFKTFVYPLNHKNIVENSRKIRTLRKTNFVLDLSKKYSEIHQNYTKELKRNLKKAENYKIEVNDRITIDEVIAIYKNSWQSRYKIPEQSYINFKKILIYAIENNIAKLKTVKTENEYLSCCAIFIFKNRIYYPFSAITLKGKKLNSTEFMINEIIKEHSESSLVLDFEGSDLESVKAFYQKFSPQNEPYYLISKNVHFLEYIIFFRKFLKNVLHFRKM